MLALPTSGGGRAVTVALLTQAAGSAASSGYLPLEAYISPPERGPVEPRTVEMQELPEIAAAGDHQADLRPLKEAVACLPLNHPLRFAILEERDSLSRAELWPKMLEWLKYLPWRER